jgi:O-antigen ligase
MDPHGIESIVPLPRSVDVGPGGGELAMGSGEPQRAPILLIGVAALTLFFVPQLLQLFPALGGLQLAKLTALLVVVYLVSSRRLLDQRVRLRNAPQVGLLLGILALALITVPTSIWPSHSIGYIIAAFGKNVLFVYLVLQAVRTDRDARVIAATLIAGCTLLSLAVVVRLGPVVTYRNEPGRLAVGGSYDPNDMALLLVIAIPFAFFMIDSCRALSRVLLVAAIALMLVGLALTESRGGFLGLCAIGALMFLIGSRQARRLTLLVAGVSVLMFTVIAPSAFWKRISTIYNYEEDYNLREEGGRVAVWKTGLQMIAANPVTGVGIACFPVEHGALSASRLQMAAHNSLIQITAELGVAGLILFVTIILVSIRRARRIRLEARRGEAERSLLWFASAVEVAFIGFAVSGFFLSHAYSPIFCFLTGMAGALAARHRLTRPAVAGFVEELEYV